MPQDESTGSFETATDTLIVPEPEMLCGFRFEI